MGCEDLLHPFVVLDISHLAHLAGSQEIHHIATGDILILESEISSRRCNRR
jgi:hypothetical protein